MFQRIAHVVRVIRSKPETQKQRMPFIPEPTRGHGLVAPRDHNPAVAIIEVALLVALMTSIVDPFIRWLLSPAPGVQTSINVIGTVLLYQVTQRLEHSRFLRPELRFLDPYFGRRLRETIRIIKGRPREHEARA